MSLLGTTDTLTLENWYVNDNQKVDTFKLADGHALAKTAVDQLVSAMAGFNPQALGTITAIGDLPASVQTVVTAAYT